MGLSQEMAKLSRKTGIPMTRQGRQRKIGKALGCCVPFAFLTIGLIGSAIATARIVTSLIS